MPKKAELLYFTGTGNSKRILSVAGDVLNKSGYRVSLRSITKPGNITADADLLGFCFPVYSLALPRIAYRYLKNLPSVKNGTKAFLFVTGGADNDCGWALIEGKKTLENKGYSVVYTELFHMPDNWLPFDDIDSPEEAKKILDQSEKRVMECTENIVKDKTFHKPLDVKKFGYLPSRFLHFIFRNVGVKRIWRFFKTSPDCNGCGSCAKACPTGSITMTDNKPKWSKTCEQCMRCIHVCPRKAVLQLESIGKGSKRNRYFEPHFKPFSE